GWYGGCRPSRRYCLAGLRQALAGLHADVEPVFGWGKRTRPLGVERARRVIAEVEVEDEGRSGLVAAEVRALGAVKEIAAGTIGLCPVRRVAERQEQAPRIAGHPVDGEASRPGRKRDIDPSDPAELHRPAAARRQ